MDLLFFAFLIFLLIGVKWQKNTFWWDTYLSKEYTNQLKGIFAITVMCHHISQSTSSELFRMLFVRSGTYAVGIFFFISGYGLMTQLKKRGRGYLKGFIPSRFMPIVLQYLFANILYFVGYNIVLEYKTISSVLKALSYGDTLVSFSWYIFAIIVFYLFFYLATKLFKNRFHAIIAVCVLQLFYIIFCMSKEFGGYWYYTCLSFPLGMFWAEIEESQKPIMDEFHKGYLISSFVLFFVLHKMTQWNVGLFGKGFTTVYGLVVNQLAVMCFCIFVVLLGQNVQFRNKAIGFIGKISFELYLYHGFFMGIVYKNSFIYIRRDLPFALAVIASSIAFAFLMNIVWNKINKHMMTFIASKRKV